PGNTMQKVTHKYEALIAQPGADTATLKLQLQSEKLESSYAGIMGKSIEPAIRPLGFDWKIGIALITSFAAREVFVGTMATLYSVGDDKRQELLLKEKMKQAKRPNGKPVFDLPTG